MGEFALTDRMGRLIIVAKSVTSLAIDVLEREDFSPIGPSPFVVLKFDDPVTSEKLDMMAPTQTVICGIHREGVLPTDLHDRWDILLTTSPSPPAPWVHVPLQRLDERCGTLKKVILTSPIAAGVLRQLLRMSMLLPLQEALQVESLAYSTLLGGNEFRRWLSTRPVAEPSTSPDQGPILKISRRDDEVTILLADDKRCNVIDAVMRDALFEALAAVCDDPSRPTVVLRGAGACFSTGGAIEEFGTAQDLAAAHCVRTLRSCAGLLASLGDRVTVILHGACIGSGIEIPAAAGHRLAREGAFFQLPEIKMGLIPGAGGTATIARTIGRHRTAYMALSARRIGVHDALDWGLVHGMAIE
jgi:Enoyl-CoA hydratase/isomerase